MPKVPSVSGVLCWPYIAADGERGGMGRNSTVGHPKATLNFVAKFSGPPGV
ncbi:hypothetical protein H5410_036620 [Solanum commersonii]|uniref:Uncharacterized protein n=1 Tax=Solanum commersonii TaxID=4109 RepID=A0A9J5Y7Z0_SOLCO|nr:hypothetical protein H5410_036620 [Solanum commersonii]